MLSCVLVGRCNCLVLSLGFDPTLRATQFLSGAVVVVFFVEMGVAVADLFEQLDGAVHLCSGAVFWLKTLRCFVFDRLVMVLYPVYHRYDAVVCGLVFRHDSLPYEPQPHVLHVVGVLGGLYRHTGSDL